MGMARRGENRNKVKWKRAVRRNRVSVKGEDGRMGRLQLHEVVSAIQHEKPEVYGFAELTRYAVLLPLVENEGEVEVLFEVRSLSLRRQPGEISFPGGKMENGDGSPKTTAVRETAEELGLPREEIEVIHDLGVIVPPYQMAIHTFVGILKRAELISFNPEEVQEVFTVPLETLLAQEPEVYELDLRLIPDKNFPYQHITGGKEYRFRRKKIPEYFFFYKNYVIWGLTARILQQFLQLVKKNI